MQERRTRPATAADFHRLAKVAHQRGLRLYRDDGFWYCTSASRPGVAYFVTGFSCTCPGFIAHQRCTHHALLLERLGWLPDPPDEEEDEPAHAFDFACAHCRAAYSAACQSNDCPECSGCGIRTYRSFEEPCSHCGGTGITPSHHLHDAPAAPMVAAA